MKFAIGERIVSDKKSLMYARVREYLDLRAAEFGLISSARRDELAQLSSFVRRKLEAGDSAKLTFICTHNSRRSHLSQIWAHIAAEYYELSNVETYSGGTEATAFNPRAVAALRRTGLQIDSTEPTLSNPIYTVRASDVLPSQSCFSKVFNAAPNPKAGYCAVMTCSQADEACPIVSGCELRLPIRYEDPKVADDTPEEAQRYDERSAQICREMLYAISLV
jgi:arsenate reductase